MGYSCGKSILFYSNHESHKLSLFLLQTKYWFQSSDSNICGKHCIWLHRAIQQNTKISRNIQCFYISSRWTYFFWRDIYFTVSSFNIEHSYRNKSPYEEKYFHITHVIPRHLFFILLGTNIVSEEEFSSNQRLFGCYRRYICTCDTVPSGT